MSTPADNARFAHALLAGLCQGGVRHVVASPGSRSTPLLLAADREAQLHMVLDERVAAFVALGLAKATCSPVALICTSGSAGAHYLPAFVEARAVGAPLIALTANRPPELWEAGAPQTIEQRGLFGDHVVAWRQLGPPAPGVDATRSLATVAAQTLARAWEGPVHLDVAFREPLWSSEPVELPDVPRRAFVRAHAPVPDLAPLERLLSELASPEKARRLRGLILCGPDAAGWALGDEDRLASALGRFARTTGWAIALDPASGLRGRCPTGAASIDALARSEALRDALRPDLVLRLGRTPTSKAARRWLADAPSVLLEPRGAWHDPDHGAALLLQGDGPATLDALRERSPSADAAWARRWSAADLSARQALARAAQDEGPLWSGALANALSASPGLLHAASSMPLRDLDLFASTETGCPRITANRGANGIDGTLATAWGLSLGVPQEQPLRVLTGDLAFLHDAGGLLAARGLGARADVFVVANGGGGIFHNLPISAHPSFERCFLTPQHAHLGALCAAAGIEHRLLETRAQLEEALRDEPRAGVRVFEVPVERALDLRQRELALTDAERCARLALGHEADEARSPSSQPVEVA